MKFNIGALLKIHLPILLAFFIISLFYFLPELQNKELRQGDVLSWKASASEAIEYNKTHAEPTMWANNMFSGMPMYQTASPIKLNLIDYLDGITHFFSANNILRWFGALLVAYFGFLLLGISPWIAALGAFLVTFNTGNFTLLEAGHTSKLRVIEYTVLLIAGVILVFKKKYWLGGAVYAAALSLQITHNHIQMTYFIMLTLLPLILIFSFQSLKNKESNALVYSLLVLGIGTTLGLATSAGRIITTVQYAKDSMRGGSVLSETKNVASSAEVNKDGLQWDYAMSWSNGWGDLLSGFIPGVVGGGSGEKVSTNSSLKNSMKKAGVSITQNPRMPMYFGELPFTSGPFYFGIVCFFLFLVGVFYLKSPFKWWLLTAVVFTMLMSMGKNFSMLNRFLFDYLPYFNKFRTPNSVLTITSILIPLLAVYTLNDLYINKLDLTRFKRSLLISTGILATVCLVIWLMGPSFWDTQKGLNPQMKLIGDWRESLMKSDAMRSLFFVLASAALLYFWTTKKVKNNYLLLGFAALFLLDVIPINRRYISEEDFSIKKKTADTYAPRKVDLQIKQDPALYYRVMDNSIDTYNSSFASNFHKTVGGYHPAKLRRYQDMIDHYIQNENQSLAQRLNAANGNDSLMRVVFNSLNVLNALNTKYFIFGNPGSEGVVINPAINGNAWFVNSIKWVNTADEEINAIQTTPLKTTAIVHNEFKNIIGNLSPTGQGTISLTEYAPNKLAYQSESSADQLAVFSEIWYGPNKGWKVSIDGQSVEHIRVNYTLRGLKIPSGKHSIVFEFRPGIYYQSEFISLFTSLSILIGLGLVGYRYYKGKSI